MAPVDVEAVNERLNGLVTLLKAVGVDSFDDKAPDYDGNRNQNKRGNNTIPDARQLDDEQIAAIIKKLQMAQSEAPQIIAALEAQAKMKRQQQQQQHETQKEDDDNDDDDEDDDSYDDDANYPMVGPGCSDDVSVVSDLTTPTVVQNPHVSDEEHYRDTLPPMLIIGGNSTGTQQHPPMLLAPTKRKNLVGSVRTNTLATAPRSNGAVGIKGPSGNNKSSNGIGLNTPNSSGQTSSKGAAAQRRKAYNATMERLTQDGGNPPPPPPSSPASTNGVYPVSPDRSSGSRGFTNNPSMNSTPVRKIKQPNNLQQQQQLNSTDVYASTSIGNEERKKVTRRASLSTGQVNAPRPSSTDDWHVPPGWDTFDPNPAPRMSRPLKKSSTDPTTLIDDDGFLMSPTADFDPFAVAVNTVTSSTSRAARRTTDARSIGSGSRKSSGSDPKSESQHRRLKKPSNSPQPKSTSPTGGSGYKNNSINPHFVEQPLSQQQRTRPQQQQSMGAMDQHYHHNLPDQQQQPKVRRSRRASLNM